MKIASFIMLLLAYLPMFGLYAWMFHTDIKLGELGDLLGKEGYTLYHLFDDMYGILTALGIALYLWSKYIKEKNYILVPLSCLFSVIGLIFLINTLFNGFYKTYWPVLITIITILLCYIIMYFFWHKYKRQT